MQNLRRPGLGKTPVTYILQRREVHELLRIKATVGSFFVAADEDVRLSTASRL